jgi:monovalent cation:H+ antiporter, CPA1 family
MTPDLTQLGLLLFVSALVAIGMRRLQLPYTVGLVLAGVGLYFAHVRLRLHLSRDLIFSVFLPPLVFGAALSIRWSELRRELPVVMTLATVGVLLTAIITAVGAHYALSWPWPGSMLFGALIAATDPVSVIATFKEAGSDGRARLLIEAESLLNDGTAAVAFVAVLGALAGDQVGVLSLSKALLVSIAGGVLVGAAAGWFFLLLAGSTSDHLVEITFTTLAAYVAFDLAERFHMSGILATLTAGLVIGNHKGTLASAGGRQALEIFWDYVAFVANSLIFLLIGAQEAQEHFSSLWLAVVVAIALVVLGRAVAVYPVCALFAHSRLRVDLRDQHVLFWGGLRGALALALALSLPADLADRNTIITVTFAVVAFSVLVQGLTITPLLRRLGQLPPR